MKQTRHSAKRDEILNYLRSVKDHPTAETIYGHVRKDIPNISLGTVYRNLTFLENAGLVQRVNCDDGSVHWDGDISGHSHLKCSGCGAVVDVFFDEDGLDSRAGASFGGIITGHDLVFKGLCERCAGNSEKGQMSPEDNKFRSIKGGT